VSNLSLNQGIINTLEDAEELLSIRKELQARLKVTLKAKHLRKLQAVRKQKALKGEVPEAPERRKIQDNRPLVLKRIAPLTKNQECTFDSFRGSNKNLVLHGLAGTGKSYMAVYLSLEEVMASDSEFERLVIVRSIVSSRDPGFMPGSMKEKQKVFESPYHKICTSLFLRPDAYDKLKNDGIVEFTTTSFLRGDTFENTIVLVDEIQNMTFQELDTIMTRIGNNCRIIFCGDYRQTDLMRDREKDGLQTFLKIIKKMDAFDYIEFYSQDVVRSSLVKSYILAKMDLGLT
jgi:phosphate starvation-inducible PhoH-like protein